LVFIAAANRPVRAVEMRAAGHGTPRLSELLAAGVVTRVGRGTYRTANAEYVTDVIAEFGLKFPDSVISGLSALEVHRIGVRPAIGLEASRQRGAGKPASRLGSGRCPIRWRMVTCLPPYDTVDIGEVPLRVQTAPSAVAELLIRWKEFPDDTAGDTLADAVSCGVDALDVLTELRRQHAPRSAYAILERQL
jgi:hypothetical protein